MKTFATGLLFFALPALAGTGPYALIHTGMAKIANGDWVVVSPESDVNGVCKDLGYQSGVPGTMIDIKTIYPEAIPSGSSKIIGSSGAVEGAGGDDFIDFIICSNESLSPGASYRTIHGPSVPGVGAVSPKSDVDAVCRGLGYEAGIPGSIVSVTDLYGEPPYVITGAGSIINAQGAVVGQDQGDYAEFITCYSGL